MALTFKSIIPTLFASTLVIMLITASAETTARSLSDPEHPPTDEKSIAPIADCTGPLIDIGYHVRKCYLSCQGADEPEEGTTIDIYKGSSQGPMVVECYKLELSQLYTQFWTFSKAKGQVIHKKVPITAEECEAAIKSNCPDHKCDTREPDDLPEEYHYGSDTTVRATLIMLHSSVSGLYVDQGKVYVSPMGSNSKFKVDELKARDGQSLYFWKGIKDLEKCPFDVIGSYGCDRYKMKEEFFYTCAKGGMTVTPRKEDKDAYPDKCPGMKIAEEGYFYRINKGDTKTSFVGKLAIEVSPGTQETADSSYMRHKIQQIAVKLDQGICNNQCEILSLEARSSNKTGHLVRAGMESFLILENGTAQYCRPLHGCRLSQPSSFCGNPPRVGIVCNGISRFWNPMHPYTETDSPCLRPDRIEKLTFNLGSTHYVVDDNLKVKVPNHMIHHRFQNEFLRYHNNDLNMNVKTLADVKSQWDSVKSSDTREGRVFNITTNIKAPHISLGGTITNVFKSVFTTVKSIEAIIGITLIIGVIVGTVLLLLNIMGVYSTMKAKYNPVSTDAVVPTMTHRNAARENSQVSAKWI